ncbi:MAG: DUF2007 domain-containing protein [Candidatus Doudnabacteria bacterium]|nr:DUF2007 domain-containing protein [Candidatus Doudnabacteria bacterium]
MKLVYTAPSEPEGKMMQEILTNAGIKSILQFGQDALSGLRTEFAGASLPNTSFDLIVRDEDFEKAKELLPID